MEFVSSEIPVLSPDWLKYMEQEISMAKERSESKKPVPQATFETLSNVDISSVIIPQPEDHVLDKKKVGTYLASLDNDISQTVELLISMTKYVSFVDLIKIMNELLSDLTKINTELPLYVYFPTDFSSENIFVMFLWEKLRFMNVKGFVAADHKIYDNEEINLIILDDCVFTGQNIDRTLYDLTTNNPNTHINFHLFIPYCSDVGFKFVNDSINNPLNLSPAPTLIWHVHETIPDVRFNTVFIETCYEHHGSRLQDPYDHVLLCLQRY